MPECFQYKVSTTRPIMLLSASNHTAYANTYALKKTWCQQEKSLSKTYPNEDCYIEDTKGVLQEAYQIGPMIGSIKKSQARLSLENLPNKLDYFFKLATKRGITLLYDASTTKEVQYYLSNFLDQQPQPHIRIGMARYVENRDNLRDFLKEHPTFIPPTEYGSGSPTKSDIENEKECGLSKDGVPSIDFYYGSVKIISDGSNQGLTGYQSTTYECPPHDYGIYNFLDNGARQTDKLPPKPEAPAEILNIIGDIHESGWPTMIHANGDQAINYALQAFKKAGTASASDEAQKNTPNRIEHCSLLNDERIKEMVVNNLTPSFLIGHVGYWGWSFESFIFKEKAEKQLDLCKSVADAGMRFTLHSDSGVSPPGPLRLMEQAVTRKMEGSPQARKGLPVKDIPCLNANERISPAQALRAVTYDAAWQCYVGDLVGSLEPGKLADFVILDEDPVTMTADSAYKSMRDICAKEVWIGGAQLK